MFIYIDIFNYITKYTLHAVWQPNTMQVVPLYSSPSLHHAMLKSACVLKPWHAAGIIDVFVSTASVRYPGTSLRSPGGSSAMVALTRFFSSKFSLE